MTRPRTRTALSFLLLSEIVCVGCASVAERHSRLLSESRVDPAPAAASPVASEPVVPATFTEPASPARPAEDNPLARLSELSSDTLVAEVLARNPSLAQMVAAWKAASARYPQVTSLDDPMFGAVVAPASIGSNDVDFGYRVEVSQKFPLFGKRGLRGENALAEASAAGNDVGAMRLEIVEAAKHAFAEYYLVGRALEVNEEGLRLLGDFRANARERYEKVQGANEQDILQADVELGRQRQRQITLERMRRVAVARINTLLHLPPDCALPPPPKELHADGVTPGGAELRALALARRPDLKALADHVRAEEANRGLADREYYPDVEVSGAYDTVMGNGPTRDLAPQIGVRLNVPLRFERRAGAVAEAEAKVAGRRAELARQTDQVSFQVQEAYEQVVESDKVVALFEEKILPAARANVKAAQSSYVGGRVPFLSLLESERNLVDLRDRYYEAVAEAFRRRATLERVTGGSEGGTPGSPDCTSCPRPARP